MCFRLEMLLIGTSDVVAKCNDSVQLQYNSQVLCALLWLHCCCAVRHTDGRVSAESSCTAVVGLYMMGYGEG